MSVSYLLDEKTIKQRIRLVIHKLHWEDAKHPGINFYKELHNLENKIYEKSPNSGKIVKKMPGALVNSAIEKAVRETSETNWRNLANDWWAGDIYEYLLPYFE